MPWWKRIIAGDSTAVPAEWLGEDGKITLSGEEVIEFLRTIDEHNVELTVELAEACQSYVSRSVIDKTGQHPDGMPKENWEELYEK